MEEEKTKTHDTSRWADYLKNRNTTLFETALMRRRLISNIIRFTPKRARLLEVGCGTGLTSILLSHMGYDVVAIDIEKNVLSQVYREMKKHNSTIDICRADMFQLNFKDKSFDVVFHQGVLEHYDDKKIAEALQEQKRIGKIIIFEVPNSRFKRKPYGDERLLSNKYWRKLISKSGLKIIYMYGANLNMLGGLWPYGLVYIFYDFFGRLFGRDSGFVCIPC